MYGSNSRGLNWGRDSDPYACALSGALVSIGVTPGASRVGIDFGQGWPVPF